jgi:hypothetical protein
LLDHDACRLSGDAASGRNVAGAALRDVGAMMAVDSPGRASACTMTR